MSLVQGPAAGVLGFVAVLVLIFLRVPVAIAMGAVGAVAFGLMNGWDSLGFVLGRVPFETVRPYSLSVIPLFVMMGVFAAHAGLSRSLYGAVSALIGHLRGGLALATIGACAIFGAICGSAIATAATMGRVALPEMRRLGYHDSLAAATVAAGGTLGVMIPPSVLFLLYGLMTEQSIGKLFMAGVLPGIVGTLLYMGAVWWTTSRHPEHAPQAPRLSWRERRASLARIWQVLILFVVVLGGMYQGFFSPTEGAAVGAFGAIVISWLGGHLNRASFAAAMKDTALTTGMIFVILIGAGVFNYFIDQTGLTDALIARVEELGLNRWVVMLMLMIMYIVLGALMDELSMILLTVGPVFKLVTSLGFDPIWFGVMLVTVCEIGMIVPPVGINLFVIQGVGNLSMNTVVRGIVPFVAADCVRMFLIALFPWLALWLPSLM